MSNFEHRRITLRDGRALAYAEFGSPSGSPIIYCHGAPSSRAEGYLTVLPSAVAELGARVIIPDRPGMGWSDFLPGRRIVDWPSDVLELADALEIDTFAVLGSSAGSPYALACGVRIPARARVVGVVGGLAPSDAPGVCAVAGKLVGRLATYTPVLLGALLRLQLHLLRSQKVRKAMAGGFPEPDRTLFQRQEIRDGFIACFEEACRNGSRGAVWELRLLAHSWGFDLGKLRIPVLLWQGERDGNVSAAHSRYLAAAIPNCRTTFYPQEAHLSVLLNHGREIFGDLKRCLKTPSESIAPYPT